MTEAWLGRIPLCNGGRPVFDQGVVGAGTCRNISTSEFQSPVPTIYPPPPTTFPGATSQTKPPVTGPHQPPPPPPLCRYSIPSPYTVTLYRYSAPLLFAIIL